MKFQVFLLLVTESLAIRTDLSSINLAMAEEERSEVSQLEAEIATLRQQRDAFQKQRDILAKAFAKDEEVAKVLSNIEQEKQDADVANDLDKTKSKASRKTLCEDFIANMDFGDVYNFKQKTYGSLPIVFDSGDFIMNTCKALANNGRCECIFDSALAMGPRCVRTAGLSAWQAGSPQYNGVWSVMWIASSNTCVGIDNDYGTRNGVGPRGTGPRV